MNHNCTCIKKKGYKWNKEFGGFTCIDCGKFPNTKAFFKFVETLNVTSE